ncbi:hypothetical protein CASFOL_001132 [Castilleja foliolosa]|uniref:AAA+ ATPase domain-containing protein n=1 Tax=Castilleja foliolosa TaxID=1961234 RepID=A0ABD3EQ02_9LAMI
MINPIKIIPETWGTIGSAALTFIFFWDMIRRYCPPHLRRYLEKWSNRLFGFLDPYVQISIHEYLGSHLKPHEAYSLVEAYLSVNPSNDAKHLKAEMKKDNDNKLMISMDENEKTTDEFNGVQLLWISGKISNSPQQTPYSYFSEAEKKFYCLKFHKRHKKMIIDTFLEHVIEKGREIRTRNRQRKLYTNGHSRSYWSHILFEHPATFETLAMEKVKKEEIIEDLVSFTKRKDYYARIGKAWKRGYLLFGPPGTGKSTMIAAMANLLEYDVYDLELTSVKDNTELRRLLTETTGKSIIVIEDIDCSLDLTGQRMKTGEKNDLEAVDKKNSRKEKDESGSKVTLSGLLNFIDGLWSASAGERMIVFTTNYVEKLDPALTRRGRMDKHIELSYCKYEGFKVLAKNYLEIEEHVLFESVKKLIGEVEITPADVAENLMAKSAKEGPEQCLLNLIRTLEEFKSRNIKKCLELKENNVEADELQEKQEI